MTGRISNTLRLLNSLPRSEWHVLHFSYCSLLVLHPRGTILFNWLEWLVLCLCRLIVIYRMDPKSISIILGKNTHKTQLMASMPICALSLIISKKERSGRKISKSYGRDHSGGICNNPTLFWEVMEWNQWNKLICQCTLEPRNFLTNRLSLVIKENASDRSHMH